MSGSWIVVELGWLVRRLMLVVIGVLILLVVVW